MKENTSNIRAGLHVIAISFALLASTVFAGTQVIADGAGSPEECKGSNGQVFGSVEGTADAVSKDVGTGFVVEGVCIKSGNNTFEGNKHSQPLGNGTYDYNGLMVDEDCYVVSGVGTQQATVTRVADNNTCQGISHIDVLYTEKEEPEEPEYAFQFAKEWDGEEINLEGVEVTFFIGDTAWQLGDDPVEVKPGQKLAPLSEQVTGLPDDCTYESDLPESFTIPEENGAYLRVVDETEPTLYTLTATNTVECDDEEVPEEPVEEEENGQVLGDTTDEPQVTVTPTGGVSAGGGGAAATSSMAVAGLVSSVAATGFGFYRFKELL